MITVAVVNLKGGTGKTTTAAYVAHVLHESGLAVLLVDADSQASAVHWAEAAGWPFPAVGLPTRTLHRDLPGIAGTRYDAVVIDTPPLEEQRGVVVSALRAATHVLTPCAPTPIEYERLAAVRAAVADVADLRPDGRLPVMAVLLTRTVPSAASTGVYRDLIAEDVPVLRVTIGNRQQFAQAYGQPITRASATGYGDVVTELLHLTDQEVPR